MLNSSSAAAPHSLRVRPSTTTSLPSASAVHLNNHKTLYDLPRPVDRKLSQRLAIRPPPIATGYDPTLQMDLWCWFGCRRWSSPLLAVVYGADSFHLDLPHRFSHSSWTLPLVVVCCWMRSVRIEREEKDMTLTCHVGC